MNWGELKTALFVNLGDRIDEFTEFEFGQVMDEAQVFLTRALPADMIPEMIESEEATLSVSSMATYDVPAAYHNQGLDVIDLRWDETDMGAGHVVTLLDSARRVGFSEFFAAKDILDEKIFLEIGAVLLVNSASGDPISTEKMKMITYKKKPTAYMGEYGGVVKTVMVRAYTTTGPGNLIELGNVASTTNYDTFDDLGVDPASFVGGMMLGFGQGSSFDEDYNSNSQYFKIVNAYDNGGQGYVEVDADAVLYTLDNYSTLLIAKPSGSHATPADDTDEPDLGIEWHGLMLDYAIAKAWLKLGDKEKAALYMSQFNGQLQQLGLKGVGPK